MKISDFSLGLFVATVLAAIAVLLSLPELPYRWVWEIVLALAAVLLILQLVPKNGVIVGLELWEFLKKNANAFQTLAAIVVVIGGCYAVIVFLILDRGSVNEKTLKTMTLFTDNAEVVDDIGREWNNLVTDVMALVQTRSGKNDKTNDNNDKLTARLLSVYSISESRLIPASSKPKANFLPISVETCIQTDQCIEPLALQQFCLPAFEWGTLQAADGLSYAQIVDAIIAAQDKNIKPEKVLDTVAISINNSSVSRKYYDLPRAAVATLLDRCNAHDVEINKYAALLNRSIGKIATIDCELQRKLGLTNILDLTAGVHKRQCN